MSVNVRGSFGSVLANRQFRALWIAQALAQTAQQAIHFVQMVLVEELTGSSTHIGLVILAFSLPGVIFSPIAGVVSDRWPKKRVLVGSNALRVVLVAGYLLVLGTLDGWGLLLGIYTLTFGAATVGQFFAPAEACAIPLLVGEGELLPANSLFNLTLAVSQVAGIIILGPLATKLIGTRGAFALIALMYLGATLSVSRLPRMVSTSDRQVSSLSGWQQTISDLREGWRFVVTHRRVLLAMGNLSLIATVILVMAMLAPGFAARVLGRPPEDAVFVFAPAGVGMLLATGILGRFGYRLHKQWASNIAVMLAGLAFAGLGLVTQGYRILPQPLLDLYPQAALSLTTVVMGISLILGLTMSGVTILGQTILQETAPPDIRGRVFALLFMINNLVGIPPLLAFGGMADWVGIPQVMLAVGVISLLGGGVSIYFTIPKERRRGMAASIVRVTKAAVRPLERLRHQDWSSWTGRASVAWGRMKSYTRQGLVSGRRTYQRLRDRMASARPASDAQAHAVNEGPDEDEEDGTRPLSQ